MTEFSKDGVYDIPMADYLADPCPVPSLSSGLAKTILDESPQHAWNRHSRLNENHSSTFAKTADVGTIAHDVLFGGEGLICEINPEDYISDKGVVPKGWTTNAIKAARDEARSNGLTPILTKDMKGITRMDRAAKSFLENSPLKGVLDRGKPEMTLIWSKDGAYFRARPDWLTDDHDIMIHYKTTPGTANPAVWIKRQLINEGYGLAFAFYDIGAKVTLKNKDCQSYFLVQEQKFPHACSLIALDPSLYEISMRKAERAMSIWTDCMATDTWPGYSTEVHYAEATPWQIAQEEEEALSE